MTLVRWNPARELMNIEKEFSKLFNTFNRRLSIGSEGEERDEYENAVWMPLTDISEDSDSYVINVDLPGVTKDDLKISYSDGQLTISGERKHEKETKEKTFHRVERTYGRYYRSFNIPKHIDTNKITAEFKDGQLNIVVPKTEESKPKEIDIKVK
jgi:HSP20 family protein